MGETPTPSIEDIASRWLETKRNSVQALADSLGVTRQALNARVKKFLKDNPGFESQIKNPETGTKGVA